MIGEAAAMTEVIVIGEAAADDGGAIVIGEAAAVVMTGGAIVIGEAAAGDDGWCGMPPWSDRRGCRPGMTGGAAGDDGGVARGCRRG